MRRTPRVSTPVGIAPLATRSPLHQHVVLTPGIALSEYGGVTDVVLDRPREEPRRYGEFGVPEYRVADPQERIVWVWRFARGQREPERIVELVTWHPVGGAAEPLELELDRVFRPY